MPTISDSSSSSNGDSSSSSQSSEQQDGSQDSNSSSNGGQQSSPQVSGTQGQSPGDTGESGDAGNSGEQNSGTQAGSQNNGQQGSGQQTAGASNNGGFESNGSANGSSSAGNQGNGDDPFGDLSAGRGQVITASERRAALDARLNEGFAEFDGMILGERERVQAEADEAGSDVMSNGGAGAGSGDGEPGGPLIVASAPSGSTGGGVMPAGNANREGDFSNTSPQETFETPDDIPSGNDDDVVARQLREAAMREPDPELRERLWDEYRAYTGLGQ